MASGEHSRGEREGERGEESRGGKKKRRGDQEKEKKREADAHTALYSLHLRSWTSP